MAETSVNYLVLDSVDEQIIEAYEQEARIEFENNRQKLIYKVNSNIPESKSELEKHGRQWMPELGILPNTQAAVHVNQCKCCYGIPSKCFPNGALQRYYPTDEPTYSNLVSIADSLREVTGLEPLYNEINPRTGALYSSDGHLRDKQGNLLY